MTSMKPIINEKTRQWRPDGHSQTTTIMKGGQSYYRPIPMPHAPVFPVADFSEFKLWGTRQPSQFDAPHLDHFIAARYALFAALKDMECQPGDEILIPAYHCKAMIYPVLKAGGRPVFYKVREDLSADLDDLETKLSRHTKAALYVSYFGFFRDIEKFRAFCNSHNLLMIEDCAHALFGHNNGIATGSFGDYAIGSVKKFLPVSLGGILTSRNVLKRGLARRRPALQENVKFFYNTLERSAQYGRHTGAGHLVHLLEKLRRPAAPPASADLPVTPESQDMENRFIDEKTNHCPPLVTYWAERLCHQKRLVQKRRENYQRLLSHVKGMTQLRPLLPQLPDGVVPYMFPLALDNLERVFPFLEDGGLPLQRFGQFLWPDKTVAACRNSLFWSRHVLQLPCHQGLRSEEIDWMIETVLRCLDKAA